MITKDSRGEKTYSEIDRVGVCIRSLKGKNSLLKVNITDPQDGCYKVTYKPEAAGEFSVYVTVSDEAINGSPFQLKVRERLKTKGKEIKRGKRKPSGIITLILIC